jgi:hypothetical protein
MIARPKISRNERKTTEIGAFEVGNFAPFSCPGAVALDAEWWKGYWYRGQALLGQLKGKRPSKVMQQKAEVALKALERASQCRGFPEDKRERVEQLQARARNIVFYLAQNQCPTQ